MTEPSTPAPGGGRRADVLVLGSGVAGLTAALTAAASGQTVAVLTKGELAASATRYAQGGVAAALAPPDSPDLHFSDTLSAGGGLCDADAVRALCADGPARLHDLIALGAAFDRVNGPDGRPSQDGPLAFAREGGHSLARVVHAGGDATGHEVERALVAAAKDAAVHVAEHWLATDLIIEDGRCAGVSGIDAAGRTGQFRATHVILACGGAGQLFAVTTNPTLSTGDGVAMALRAGAAVADVEFMQFHPTALAQPGMPRPLLSEALRGEGAVLRDEAGVAFMAAEHPLADLAPRDVVSRSIARRLVDRNLDHLWLDATGIPGFARRFPTIWAGCRDVGLDPTSDWLPVAPAAHYLCGGVVTDLDGAASIPGLWACGEVACTGVHGANRLASNSLLEGLVFGHRAGRAIAAGRLGPEPTGALRGVPLEPVAVTVDAAAPSPGSAGASTDELRARLQQTMTVHAGVLRDEAGLKQADADLREIAAATATLPSDTPAVHELRALIATGLALVAAAAERTESRGCHHRLDHPDPAGAADRIVHFAGDRRRVPAHLT